MGTDLFVRAHLLVMKIPKQRDRVRNILLSVLLFLVLYAVFAPYQIGGEVAYVIVSGNSMEPRFKRGDLVLTRDQPDYRVGEIVVYEHPKIGKVFHRIIQQDGEVYTLKGDHNYWIDFYQPTNQEILGKLWVHIPTAGRILRFIKSPGILVFLSLLIGVLTVMVIFGKEKPLTRRQIKKRKKPMKRSNPTIFDAQEERLEILIFLGILLLVGMLLGAFAFTRPPTLKVTDDIQYKHQGELTYSAQDTADVFDTEEIRPGEPVFLNLDCEVKLQYQYAFSLAENWEDLEVDDLQGTYHLKARVSDVNGWNRTILLTPPANFSSRKLSSKAELDLCQIRELITHMETVTGVSNRWYDVTILPEVFVQGQIMSRRLEDGFMPIIPFELDAYLMRLRRLDEESPLISIKEGTIPNFQQEANTLSFFGLQVPVSTARWISGGLCFLSLAVGGWIGWPVIEEWQKGAVERIQIQYSPMLIDVQEGSLGDDGTFIDVVSFQDLSKLAERYGAVILHEQRGQYHRYLVQDGETVYQFALESVPPEAVFPNFAEFKRALEKAIDHQELQLYYQPIISLESQDIVGMEGLLRWNHPQHGILYPSEFIKRAEESALIDQIDSWVFQNAYQQLESWMERGVPLAEIFINISSARFLQPGFADWVGDLLNQGICDPGLIQLEINNANIVSRDEVALENLKRIQAFGVGIVIDNFAAADANQIDHLSKLYAGSVKIDQSLTHNSQANGLIEAVVQMAKSFQLQVIGQGVETRAQVELMREQDVDAVQGFYISRPVPAEEAARLLEQKVDLLKKTRET